VGLRYRPRTHGASGPYPGRGGYRHRGWQSTGARSARRARPADDPAPGHLHHDGRGLHRSALTSAGQPAGGQGAQLCTLRKPCRSSPLGRCPPAARMPAGAGSSEASRRRPLTRRTAARRAGTLRAKSSWLMLTIPSAEGAHETEPSYVYTLLSWANSVALFRGYPDSATRFGAGQMPVTISRMGQYSRAADTD